MTIDVVTARQELRALIDAYAILGDEKKIAEQMQLFTPDARYVVYMNHNQVGDTTGADNIGREFSGHAAMVDTYFTLNGQHVVAIENTTATGVSFSQIKMVRKDVLTDYSVRYDDKYVYENGAWRIQERTGHFLIVASTSLTH